MKGRSILAVAATAVLLAGCATGRNYQTDIDSLNAKIASLQDQLSMKDQEISRLQSQTAENEMALRNAEEEKRRLADRLDSAMNSLNSASSTAKKPASDSYLK